MATSIASAEATDNRDSITNTDILTHITTIRASIQQHYTSLIDAIKQRESQLLQELYSIEQTYRQEYQTYQTTIDELEKTKQLTVETIFSEDIKDLRDNIVKQVAERVNSIKLKIEPKKIAFEWDAHLANAVLQIGRLITSEDSASLSIDYMKKVNPSIKTCTQGTGAGEITYAWGVAADSNTNNIYVVDHNSSRVCVFSSEGEFLFQFNGNTNNTVKMNNPIGIAIHDNKVFVSQHSSHCIQIYNLDGTYMQQFGSHGTGKDQLIYPYGIAISPTNGDIYVCDNNRVQIFSRGYKHKSFLGMNQLQYPHDIKVEMPQVTEIDEALYSRQLYVLGHEAMRRMQGSNVLISGMAGIGVEIAKNVILTGVKSVTILDDSLSEFEDLGCNYYASESKIGQPRSQVVLDSLAELNSYVKVSAMCGSLSRDIIKDYEVIVLCNASTAEQLKIGDITHYLGKKLICVNLFGLFGNIFCDFGKEFLISDKNGEQPTSTIIQYISKEKESVVTCLEETRHNLETGDYVTFTEVEGMKELNNCEPIQITELGPYTFSIGDTTALSDYDSGGIVHEIKMPVTLKFKSLRESLSSPDFLISDFGKFDRPGHLLIGFQALDEYVTEKGHLPRSYNKEDAEHFISICEKMNSESAGHKVDALDKEALMHLAYVCRGELMPMISTLGGIASQEVMKAATGKFTPIQQFFFFDTLECLPKDQKDYPYDIQIKGKDRYARQKLIFGEEFHEQISNQRYFIVGSGALGCEMLKNFSMMGVSSGEFGKIIVTDMGTIKKSNLNRQFLFRQGDVQSNKSSVATKAALKMNPDMNIVAYQNRVGPATEAVYNDAFFHDLTGVANAVDNVDARIYMAKRCVYYRIPLLESGTLGTKGNVKVILPYITESYESTSDPQDKGIPISTLKAFPYAIEHTLQWARDKFDGLFTQAPQNVLQYLSDPRYLERTLKLPGQEPYFILSEIKETFSKWPKSFQDCISYARLLFEEYFNSQICQLLYNFPSGHKNDEGMPFWSGTKRCPTPIVFSKNEVTHIDFVEATALLFAEVYNISTGEMDRAKIALLIDNVIVPKFKPNSGVNIAVTYQETQAQTQPTTIEPELQQLIDSLPKISEVQGKLQIQPIDFEKDDDSNHHMDFIVACSNHRATNYSIPTADKHKSKGIAGKIIPAIVTTAAAIVGLVCLEFYKVVRDRDNYKKVDIADYKNAFINLSLPFFGFSEPIPAPIIKYFDNEFTLWDRFEIDGRRENGEMTLGEFKKHFEDMKINISMISQGVTLIYSFFLNPQKAAERFALPVSTVVEQFIKEPIPAHQTSIVLEMCCEDLEGNDLEIPYIKYDFR